MYRLLGSDECHSVMKNDRVTGHSCLRMAEALAEAILTGMISYEVILLLNIHIIPVVTKSILLGSLTAHHGTYMKSFNPLED